MLTFLKISLTLLTTSLVITSCGSLVPDFPEIWSCQFNGNPRAFYCVNTKTKEQKKIAIDDPAMKAAQCMSADDYKKSEDWVQTVINIANERCR